MSLPKKMQQKKENKMSASTGSPERQRKGRGRKSGRRYVCTLPILDGDNRTSRAPPFCRSKVKKGDRTKKIRQRWVRKNEN